MGKSYSILAKKAIVILISALFLVSEVGTAAARVPNDPNFNDQEKMWTQVNAPAGWDVSIGSPDVVVAIIDTGADTWHGDLSQNIWTNPYELADNGRDDDNNGYVDDIHGWNFVEGNSDVRTSVFDNNDDPEAVRHGTVVAGLIGASGDNGVNGVGVNWQVKIMPLRAIESSGSGLLSVIAKAVDYATDNGAAVISMSFVGPDVSEALKDSLYRAYKKGVVVVTAAGNRRSGNGGDLDREPTYPACFDKGDRENWLLTVAAVNADDQLSRFSNFGSCVDIVAPGEGIFSTERYAPQFGYPNEFGGPRKGTSFAAPLVAGAAALIKSRHSDWGPDQIIAVLLQTADSVEANNPTRVGQLGRGRLNIGKAMLAAESAITAPSLPESIYYFKGPQVGRFDLQTGSRTALVKVHEAEIVSLAVTNKIIALGVRRGDYYYIRLLREKGEFWKEFPLAIPEKSGLMIKKIRLLGGDFGRFIVEQFNPKTKITALVEFNARGEKVKDLAVKGKLAAWSASDNSAYVVVATAVNKNKFSFQQINWDSGEKRALELPGTALDDLKLAKVWAEGEQVIAVVHQGQLVRQVVADLPTGSSRSDILAEADRMPWKLTLLSSADGNLLNILPWSRQGGVFTVATGKGQQIKQVKLPQFDESVY